MEQALLLGPVFHEMTNDVWTVTATRGWRVFSALTEVCPTTDGRGVLSPSEAPTAE